MALFWLICFALGNKLYLNEMKQEIYMMGVLSMFVRHVYSHLCFAEQAAKLPRGEKNHITQNALRANALAIGRWQVDSPAQWAFLCRHGDAPGRFILWVGTCRPPYPRGQVRTGNSTYFSFNIYIFLTAVVLFSNSQMNTSATVQQIDPGCWNFSFFKKIICIMIDQFGFTWSRIFRL